MSTAWFELEAESRPMRKHEPQTIREFGSDIMLGGNSGLRKLVTFFLRRCNHTIVFGATLEYVLGSSVNQKGIKSLGWVLSGA